MTISLPIQTARLVDTEAKKLGMISRSEFIRNVLRGYFSGMQFEVFTPRPLGDVKSELINSKRYNQKFINSVVSGLVKSSLYVR